MRPWNSFAPTIPKQKRQQKSHDERVPRRLCIFKRVLTCPTFHAHSRRNATMQTINRTFCTTHNIIISTYYYYYLTWSLKSAPCLLSTVRCRMPSPFPQCLGQILIPVWNLVSGRKVFTHGGVIQFTFRRSDRIHFIHISFIANTKDEIEKDWTRLLDPFYHMSTILWFHGIWRNSRKSTTVKYYDGILYNTFVFLLEKH